MSSRAEVSRRTSLAARLVHAADRMGIAVDAATAGALVALLDRMSLEPQNLTAIDSAEEGVDRHLADSLSGLVLDSVRAATAVVDLGSGGGFPGIPLAVFSPDCAVTLVESGARKADWLARTSSELPNVRVVAERAETLARSERERWPLATARALAPLPVTVELAAPLVAVGGVLVVWQGRRDPDLERRAARAAGAVGLSPLAVTRVEPFAGADRHLHEFRKVAPAPERFPRRPGRAAKRPLA